MPGLPRRRRRPLPGPRPEHPRDGTGRGRRRDARGRLHGGNRCLHQPQHRDVRRRVARPPSRRCWRVRQTSAGGGGATSRQHSAVRTRAPWRRAAAVEVACGSSTLASTRSASATRSGSACRLRSGPCRGGRRGRDPARPDGVPLPRHARHGAGQRGGRARCRSPVLRLVDRRDGRLPICPGRRGQSRHRGSRLFPRRVGHRARRRSRGRARRREVHRARPREAARDEGRPGRRLGSARAALPIAAEREDKSVGTSIRAT